MSQKDISCTRSTLLPGRPGRHDQLDRAGPFCMLFYTFASLGMLRLSTSW